MKNLRDMRGSNFVSTLLRAIYATSEVTSGEYIHTAEIPSKIKTQGEVYELTAQDIKHGIQSFLDWDDSPEEFDIFKLGKVWYTTQHNFDDWVEYKGIRYPLRVMSCTIDEHDDDWIHYYQIAPESLIDAIQATGDGYLGCVEDDDFDEDGYVVDSKVYHYVEDTAFFKSASEICEEHLDLPMTYINEEA
jgi:hypothetical protein